MIKKSIAFFLLLGMTFLGVIMLSPHSNDVYASTEQQGELRGVWMTPVTADLSSYTNEAEFKSYMLNIFDMLEYYNLNTIFYHVRTHNNALYRSSLNPKSSAWTHVNFNEFDPLTWLIEETHSRGMEFHAWFNPYRLGTNYVGTIPSENPASNSNNILTSTTSNARILNPGLPNVREFIVETILEVVENYDVDAVHFDDYFYINLGANGATFGDVTILNEPDQVTYETYAGSYNTNSATDKANWRREQVNLLIESVSQALKDHNTLNNKYVQFGISPTGIYKNGDGIVTYDEQGHPITTGSQTGGQTHYSSYLFSDSLTWIKEGWLDYILPQSYWATNHNAAGYYNVMGWWDKVMKHLDVNLYSGIGVYQADDNPSVTNRFGWHTDMQELKKQFAYMDTLKNVSGMSVFSLANIRNAYNNTTHLASQQINNARSDYLSTKSVLPVIKSFDPIHLPQVSNLVIQEGNLTWDKIPEAKFYYIYRSQSALNYTEDEIIGVINHSSLNKVTFKTNDTTDSYTYGVKALSHSNHLGEAASTQNTEGISMVDGASIRIGDETISQGLRFYARLDKNIPSIEHGFYIVYGKTSKENLLTAIEQNHLVINDKKVFKKSILNTDSNGVFSVVLTHIPEIGYTQNITVFAYYIDEEGIHISSNQTTRSIGEVAIRMMKANESYLSLNSIKEYLQMHTSHTGINAFGDEETIIGIYETNHFILREEFIQDWNDKFGTAWTNLPAATFHAHAKIGISSQTNIANSNIYKFFHDEKYGIKWKWLLHYLKSVDTGVHPTRQINAILADGTYYDEEWSDDRLWEARHINHSIANFFNQAYETDGYPPMDFTDPSIYATLRNYNNQILIDMDYYTLINN